MTKKSIQGKIMQITILPFIAIIATVFIVFSSIANRLLYDNFHSQLQLKSEANLAHIDSTISRYTQMMSSFIFDLENYSDRSEETYKAAIDGKLSAFPKEDVSAFYIAYGERNYLYETLGWVPNSEYDVNVRPWYTIPISTPGQNILTYADANTGIYALCISEQIKTDTGEPAVIAIDIVITTVFESAKMSGEYEYFFIQDSDGVIIYHPNAEFMPHDGKMIQLADALPAYGQLSNLKSGAIINLRDYDGAEYAFTAIDLPECGFRIYTGIQMSVVRDEIGRILLSGTILVIGLLVLFAIILLLFIRRRIAAPLRFAASYLGDVADTGNLAIAEQRKRECEKYLKSGDEISRLTESFTRMIGSFAVVAEEVRNLAAKSAEAAKDTGGLITNSMEKAALGAKIAEETSVSLRGIVDGITESTVLVNEIALSGDEQASSVNDIRDGVSQVSEVVQKNSASAQESAAASEEMSGQADVLGSLVAQFKVRDDISGSRLPAARNYIEPYNH